MKRNIKIEFKIKAQVYGADLVPTTEEFSEAIRDSLITDYGFDVISVHDLKLEVSDDMVYDVKVRCNDEN